ncbi:MAG: efflux transporter outer membrane subunit [Pseudomonadota bacterium]
MKKIVFISAGLIFIHGCAVGPDYKRPKINVPDQHRGALTAADKKSLADMPWWDIFKDPVLKELIDEAIKSNFDLQAATAKIEQYRELARIKRADYYPQINYSGMDNYGKGVTSYGLPTTGKGNMMMSNVQMQWELDIWGKVRRSSESATAQFFSTIENQRAVTILLIAEVAKAYMELRELDNELAIAKRTTESFEGTYNLFTKRYKGGDASLLESSRAGASLAQAAASIPNLENQIFEKENEINFLLGRAPGPIPRGQSLNEQYMPPETPAGLPSALLERRPDVRQAEQNLISANAEIGVAKADFFPQFSLTGLLGTASADLKTYSNSWAVGGSITGPVFNGGKISANYQASKYYYEQVRLQYEKTVMNALKEVSNALTLQQKLVTVRDEQAKAVDFLRKANQLALDRYTRGLARYDEVLDVQQELFPAETNLVKTDRDKLLAVVQLFKALGGGWEQK